MLSETASANEAILKNPGSASVAAAFTRLPIFSKVLKPELKAEGVGSGQTPEHVSSHMQGEESKSTHSRNVAYSHEKQTTLSLSILVFQAVNITL